MVMLKSTVIPAFASAITLLQSTIPPAVMSARSVGVRATPARKRALYERANWMTGAAVSARPLIHVVRPGKIGKLVPGDRAHRAHREVRETRDVFHPLRQELWLQSEAASAAAQRTRVHDRIGRGEKVLQVRHRSERLVAVRVVGVVHRQRLVAPRH